RRHTRFSRDWSSDVCSSDLRRRCGAAGQDPALRRLRRDRRGGPRDRDRGPGERQRPAPGAARVRPALRRGEAAGADRPRPRPAAPRAADGRADEPPRHRLPAPCARGGARAGARDRGGAARPEPRLPVLRPRDRARRGPGARRGPARRGARGGTRRRDLRRRRRARPRRRRHRPVPLPRPGRRRGRRPRLTRRPRHPSPIPPRRPFRAGAPGAASAPTTPGAAPMTRTAAEDQQAWNRYWTRWAAEYDEHQLSRLSLPGEREAWSRAFGVSLPAGTREVLDLGTGSGNVALLLAADGYDVTGIDLSPGMLAQARAKLAGHPHPPTFLEADAANPPFAQASLD